MTHRTVICVLLAVVPLIAGCGNSNTPETEAKDDTAGVSAPVGPFGLRAMEAHIIVNSNVVKARMTAVAPYVVVVIDSEFYPGLKFNLNVLENLKGKSQTNIVAFWVSGHRSYGTITEAATAATALLAARDSQWDNREAVFFLDKPSTDRRYYKIPEAMLKPANHYLLVWNPFSFDDMYTLHSRFDRRWLPAAPSGAGSGPTRSSGDDQEFLLAVPTGSTGGQASVSSTSNVDTITLGDVKSLIQTTMSEYNGGDGSTAYKKCVFDKYDQIELQRKFEAEGRQWTYWPTSHTLASGLPARTLVHEYTSTFRDLQNGAEGAITYTVTGDHADLFAAESGPRVSIDEDNDGTRDKFRFTEFVRTTRPLPPGRYEFGLDELWPIHAICGRKMRSQWDVTVTGPVDRVLHEAFFDPVAIGEAVGVDATNGMLKPVSFTDANGASAIIEGISYESSTVKVEIDPHDALFDHIVDIIELDGTVSLSLDVADATVDAANDTLSWAVAEQPWEDGDKLMVRIREAR